jgi:CBS domain-containing protein
MKVRDVMTVRVATLRPDEALERAAALFIERRIGGAPVVTEDGEVVGVLSTSDLARSRAAVDDASRPVAEAMSTDVLSLDEGMELSEAARALEQRRVKRAPVLRDGRLVGMVTRSDLLRPHLRTDHEIRADVEMDVLVRTLGLSPRSVRVDVRDGIVHLSGRIGPEGTRTILRRLADGVDGVVAVIDDTTTSADEAEGAQAWAAR